MGWRHFLLNFAGFTQLAWRRRGKLRAEQVKRELE